MILEVQPCTNDRNDCNHGTWCQNEHLHNVEREENGHESNKRDGLGGRI
jgi:hypothetical protein